MTDETNTDLEQGPTDNVELSDNDNSDELDYYDPDEDQDNDSEPSEEETDDEADEAEASEEAEGQEAEGQADEEEPLEDFITKLKAETPRLAKHMDELEQGNLRQSDYTRKSQELSNDRDAVKADAQRIESITNTFVEYLSTIIPPEPDTSLALRDPNQYTAQKAQYDAALAQVQKLIELGETPKNVSQGMNTNDHQKLVADENQKLAALFPETGTQQGRQKFFSEVQTVAHHIGFTDAELNSMTDHRMFALAQLAKEGMAAQKAKVAVKVKAQKAPPVAPRKRGQGANRGGGNASAMRKLSKSGSLQDAMAVDFD